MWYWIASATYADGTEINQRFPYNEGDNYTRENERQYELEEWLLGQHEDCTWYSVDVIEAED